MHFQKRILNSPEAPPPPVRDVPLTPKDDRELVDDCLAGDLGAWSMLYQACHPKLCAAISTFLRRLSADIDLVDEISARVWYAVVRNDGELLNRFEPERGCRLTTFLAAVAKSEAKQYFRSEKRRKRREALVSRSEVGLHSNSLPDATICQDEFVASLSPSERAYYESVLLAIEGSASTEYSREYSWQLRHRVRTKLNRFFE